MSLLKPNGPLVVSLRHWLGPIEQRSSRKRDVRENHELHQQPEMQMGHTPCIFTLKVFWNNPSSLKPCKPVSHDVSCLPGDFHATSNWLPVFRFSRACRLKRKTGRDRKSTRLNSSHLVISYAVFCLKKKSMKLAIFRSATLLRRVRS